MPATSSIVAARYQLGDRLGRGGMSDVYHARDLRLGRDVAVKILRTDRADNPIFYEHFRREARNAARLNHFAIVVTLDTGEVETDSGVLPYIVMERLDGRTLRDVLDTEGALEAKRAIEIAGDICSALYCSHQNGIIHRDIKPANVMITKAGVVKVMDFGIAHAIHGGESIGRTTGGIIGTAEYVSPEHARGEAVDARSDVYSVGCVLYELLVGRPPFRGDSVASVVYQQVRDDPLPPSEVNPAVSQDLDAVVLKALSKGPSNRYQSAAEMRTDLVRVRAGHRPAAPRVLTAAERAEISDVTDHAPASRGRRTAARDVTPRRGTERRSAKPLVMAAAALLLVLWLTGGLRGSEQVVRVPDMVGRDHEAAAERLRNAGFDVVERDNVSCWRQDIGEKPPCTRKQIGKVLGIEPSAGTKAATSTPITLRVGTAPENVRMPNLVGKPLAEVKEILDDKDLLLKPRMKTLVTTDRAQAGRVAWQEPRWGAFAAQGDFVTVTMYVQPEMVPVVDYTGRQFGVAEAALTSVGFAVVRVVVDAEAPEGVVLEQSPNSGRAAVGSEVVLTVSNGAYAPIDMPDVIGSTEEQARDALRSAGHAGEVVIVTEEVAEYSRNGTVLRTEPSRGATLPRTDSVTLYIGETSVDVSDSTWDPSSRSTTERSPSPTTGFPQAGWSNRTRSSPARRGTWRAGPVGERKR